MAALEIYYYADRACTKPDPAGLFWRAAANTENGSDSAVVARSWVRWSAMWGASSFKIVAWSKTAPLGEPNYAYDYWELPAPARKFTAEGKRAHAGAIISVEHLMLAH